MSRKRAYQEKMAAIKAEKEAAIAKRAETVAESRLGDLTPSDLPPHPTVVPGAGE